jgi:hypothetical protein
VHHRPRLSPALAAAALLAACSHDPAPLPQAFSPACGSVLGRLPARVLDQPRTSGSGGGAASWGDPAIRLRCGLAPGGPTTAPCTSVDGVDWVLAESDDPITFSTYGRDPGVEVSVPLSYGRQNATAALVDLAAAVSPLPARRRCT